MHNDANVCAPPRMPSTLDRRSRPPAWRREAVQSVSARTRCCRGALGCSYPSPPLRPLSPLPAPANLQVRQPVAGLPTLMLDCHADRAGPRCACSMRIQFRRQMLITLVCDWTDSRKHIWVLVRVRRMASTCRVTVPRIMHAGGPRHAAAVAACGEMLRRRVLHCDEDLLVLDKPAGLAVQGGPGRSLCWGTQHWLSPQASLPQKN